MFVASRLFSLSACQVHDCRRTMTLLFNHTLPSDRANASLSSFLWAASMVMSRAFGLREESGVGVGGGQQESGGAGSSRGRVKPLAAPFADLFDHAVDCNAERRVSREARRQEE